MAVRFWPVVTIVGRLADTVVGTMDGIFAQFMSAPWLGVTICATAAVLAALACYAVTRKLFGRRLAEDSELLARVMIARLGTLHALILALIFAHEMFDYLEITKAVNREVSAISDVYYDLNEYDRETPQLGANIRGALTDYVEGVLRDERVARTDERLSERTWADYRRVGRALRALEPSTEDQSDLRKDMLADWDAVSEFRHQYGTAAGRAVPFFFWLVAISGFFSVVIPSYAYSPRPTNLLTLSTFAAYNGIVVYAILAAVDPFTEPGAIESTALENLLAVMKGQGV